MLINNSIFSKSGIPLYQRLLKVASSAQKVTAANIANVATPGYQAKNVDFKEEMRKSISSQQRVTPIATDSRHFSLAKPDQAVRIENMNGDDGASGINDVDIEKQMTDLAENQMIYDFGARRLARTFGLLRMAIRGKGQ
jgi:flagellar basal-body rod protein FlgB